MTAGKRLCVYPILSLCLVFDMADSVYASEKDNDWNALKGKLSNINATWSSIPDGIRNTKLTTGMLMGNGDIGVVAGDSVGRQTYYFGKSDFWGASVKTPNEAKSVWQESILSLGGLTIYSQAVSRNAASAFKMEQDILNAEVHTSMQLGNAIVTMTSWTADADHKADNNYFITELSSDKDVTLTSELWVPSTYTCDGKVSDCSNIYPYTSGVTSGILWTTRENYNYNISDHSGNYKVRAAIAASLIGSSFNNSSSEKGKAIGSFTLKAGKQAYIIVAFVSGNSIGDDNCPAVRSLLDAALKKVRSLKIISVKKLESNHKLWWKYYWLKSFVNLNDTVFEKYYYGSLYVLGSASRAGNFPPSLYGNWITTDVSSWGGRYFLNYNEQAAFYGVCSSNRPELILPFANLILKEMPFQRNRTHAAGYDGICHQRSLCPYAIIKTPPQEIPVAAQRDWKKLPADQKSNGVFAALPLIWYYEYTQDVKFLRDKLYPYMKELDAFYRSYMVKDKKPYIIEHSSAHEGSDDINPNLDIGFCRRICRTLIDASNVLSVDSQLRPVWQDVLDNLSDYPTIVRNGKVVYVEAAVMRGSTDPKRLFHAGDQPVNLEGAVFPGENIYLGGDTAQLRIARESLDQLGGWCVNNRGSEHNGFPKHWPVAARIGWPADDLFKRFKEAIVYHWRDANFTAFQGGGGIETIGALEAVNSMLLQSEGGVIKLFPVWPARKDASFKQLRAKGAFLVSSELKNGTVTSVNIASEKGKAASIQNPWRKGTVKVIDITNDRKVAIVYSRKDGKIVFNTKVGGKYIVSSL